MDKHFINYYVSFVWLFCLLVSNTVVGGYSSNNCSSTEREALIAFKQALSDPSDRLSSWVGHNCCEWHGITCNVLSGKVTKIDLHNSMGSVIFQFVEFGVEEQSWIAHSEVSQDFQNCLRGKISSSLLQLKCLRHLDLSGNDFEGAPIPHFIGKLKNLRYLDLSSANFSGQIPIQLGNLSNLNYLDLSGNNQELFMLPKLHVRNLQWLSGLSSLEYLNLGWVNLSNVQTNWMHAINGLSSLSELHLSNCEISSFDISSAFRNLSSLKVLDLSFNWINSSIPSLLSNLTSISTLDLRYNRFQGAIPQGFVKLKNLQYLDLSWNELGNIIGDHPPSFPQNLCKLQFLHLADNRFEVKLEEVFNSFSNCSNKSLESLDLAHNGFMGEIPNSLGTFKNLRFLNLSYNDLWGSLPNSICNLSLLQHLLILDNFLNGTIAEAHLVNLTKLEIFEIETKSTQDLVFNISRDWIAPFQLKNIYLKNCFIGLQFPIWIQTQIQLTQIILSNVGISGSLPNEWISKVSSQLIRLDLSNNLLNVKLSHIFTSDQRNHGDGSENLLNDLIPLRYPNLRHLILRNNQLSGHIPLNINKLMPNLYELNLSKNDLDDTIPSSIKTMNHLKVLLMSDNQLFGELFDIDWSRLKSLFVVDLSNNNLHGKIPTTIGLLTSLKLLMLSNNNLHGEIPKSLQNCSLLTNIDLSGNRFLYGNLPSWIGVALPELRLLNLRSNRFSGTIPRQWCNLPFLHTLDLSNNRLFGEVPSCLYSMASFVLNYSDDVGLKYHYFNKGIMHHFFYKENTKVLKKGSKFDYKTILSYIITLDLSRNNLSGEIPNEITKLIFLNILNLSRNALIGTIPENIGAMKKLETLDLSYNHLTGRIPASLTSLNFLTHLNMSFNNLTGGIPMGNQLQTLEDPSIYEGNPFLCGSPLQIKCLRDESSNIVPTSTSKEEEEEEEEKEEEKEDGQENDSEMFGFYISMAIGFPVGFNILFFTIFTNEARRIFYFRFIDRVNYNILQTIDFLTIGLRRMVIWR